MGQRTLGAAEDKLGAAVDRGAMRDGDGGMPEWPGKVSARVLRLGGSRALRLARTAGERWRRQASG
jgi:hypothetical protein